MESRPRENSSEDAAHEADLLRTQHNAGLNIVGSRRRLNPPTRPQPGLRRPRVHIALQRPQAG